MQAFRYLYVINSGDKADIGDKVFAGGDAVNRTTEAISAIVDSFRTCKAIDEMLSSK